MKKKKPLGNITRLKTNIGFPNPNNQVLDIDINKLSIFVGHNGSGKTVFLIQVWIVNYITNIYLHNPKIDMTTLEKTLSWIFDKSFVQNDFTGSVKAEFEHLVMSFDINNGVVSNLTFSSFEELTPNDTPVFMERMLNRLSDPFFKINDSAKESLKQNMNKDILHVFYDDKKCDIIVSEMKDNKKIEYSVRMLSNGEQSMLNMFIQY
jgi:hypothetical protein